MSGGKEAEVPARSWGTSACSSPLTPGGLPHDTSSHALSTLTDGLDPPVLHVPQGAGTSFLLHPLPLSPKALDSPPVWLVRALGDNLTHPLVGQMGRLRPGDGRTSAGGHTGPQ